MCDIAGQIYANYSVQYIRNRKCERRDLGIEFIAIISDHLVASLHRANGCIHEGARGVLEAFAGLQVGLFANNALTTYFLNLSVAVSNNPVSCQELGGLFTFITDGYRIREYVMIIDRV